MRIAPCAAALIAVMCFTAGLIRAHTLPMPSATPPGSAAHDIVVHGSGTTWTLMARNIFALGGDNLDH